MHLEVEIKTLCSKKGLFLEPRDTNVFKHHLGVLKMKRLPPYKALAKIHNNSKVILSVINKKNYILKDFTRILQ